jgi:hypothetical protein
VDVTDPTSPIGLGTCETGGGIYYGVGCAYRVAVAGSFVFVADGEAGFGVIDVSNPRQPKQVNRYDTGNATMSIGIRDNFCLVVDYGMGFQVIDVSNPFELQRLWVDPLTKWSRSVALVGNLAYIAGESIFVFDISDPRRPTRISPAYVWTSSSGGVCETAHGPIAHKPNQSTLWNRSGFENCAFIITTVDA